MVSEGKHRENREINWKEKKNEHWASQVALVVKNSHASEEDVRDMGSIPGLGRSPGEGNGHPPQYSCLENPMDRGGWWSTVHAVTVSRSQLVI